MFNQLLITAARLPRLFVASLTAPPDGVTPISARRRWVMLAFWPSFLLLIIHWIGLLLDELLFRGYRRIVIREPLFVLGVPRSGTTHLHRILAEDEQFTTFSTWECLFAPSIAARRFWMGLGWLDARLGQPLARLTRGFAARGFAALDDVHAMNLSSAEEDYLALLPILACFILVLPFPHAEFLWRLGRFDRDLPAAERARILDFYELALKKHLYVHGPDKRLLSKNAAFAPLAHGLVERFPDARFIVCLREPLATLPSQLSSIAPGLAFFGTPARSAAIRDRFVTQMHFYYSNLSAALGSLPAERRAWLGLHAINRDLGACLTSVYRQLALPLSASFAAALRRDAEHSRAYRSRHRYSLEQFGLERAALTRIFASIHQDPVLAPYFDPRHPSAAPAATRDPLPDDSDPHRARGNHTGNLDPCQALPPSATPPRAAVSG